MLMSIHGQLIENDPYTKKPHDKSPFENETFPQIKKMDHLENKFNLEGLTQIRLGLLNHKLQ